MKRTLQDTAHTEEKEKEEKWLSGTNALTSSYDILFSYLSHS